MAKWICKNECYIQVSGAWGYYYAGDKAEGEINKASQKHFDIVVEAVVELEAPEPTNRELRAKLDEKGTKYGPQDNKAKLKALLED